MLEGGDMELSWETGRFFSWNSEEKGLGQLLSCLFFPVSKQADGFSCLSPQDLLDLWFRLPVSLGHRLVNRWRFGFHP